MRIWMSVQGHNVVQSVVALMLANSLSSSLVLIGGAKIAPVHSSFPQHTQLHLADVVVHVDPSSRIL